jgi:hypothetical protein
MWALRSEPVSETARQFQSASPRHTPPGPSPCRRRAGARFGGGGSRCRLQTNLLVAHRRQCIATLIRMTCPASRSVPSLGGIRPWRVLPLLTDRDGPVANVRSRETVALVIPDCHFECLAWHRDQFHPRMAAVQWPVGRSHVPANGAGSSRTAPSSDGVGSWARTSGSPRRSASTVNALAPSAGIRTAGQQPRCTTSGKRVIPALTWVGSRARGTRSSR